MSDNQNQVVPVSETVVEQKNTENTEHEHTEVATQAVEAVVENTEAAVEAVVENTEAAVEAVEVVVENTEAAVEAVVENTEAAVEAVVENTEAAVEAVDENTEAAVEAVVENTEAAVEAVDETLPVVTLETSFGQVKYQSSWSLNRGSLLQLLACYAQRVSEQKAESGNLWQESAYPKLATLVNTLRDAGFQMYNDLVNDPEFEKDVVTVNLCGFENINFSLSVFVVPRGVKRNLRYNNANVRDFFLHIVQRCRYVTSCNVPARYSGDEKRTKTFLAVQERATKFLDETVHNAREQWRVACDEAGKHAGLSPKQEHLVEQKFEQKPRVQHQYDGKNKTQKFVVRGKRLGHNGGDDVVVEDADHLPRYPHCQRPQRHQRPQHYEEQEQRKPVNRELAGSGVHDQVQSPARGGRGGDRCGRGGRGDRGEDHGGDRGGARGGARGGGRGCRSEARGGARGGKH